MVLLSWSKVWEPKELCTRIQEITLAREQKKVWSKEFQDLGIPLGPYACMVLAFERARCLDLRIGYRTRNN
jgi:hypothetical protein